jgi:mRNA interferase HigB
VTVLKNPDMRIINQGRLADFAVNHADSINALNKWEETITIGNFKQPHDLLKEFPSADYVGNDRYVFDIKGNKYRIIAVVVFIGKIVDVRFVGTHAEYNKINSKTV